MLACIADKTLALGKLLSINLDMNMVWIESNPLTTSVFKVLKDIHRQI